MSVFTGPVHKLATFEDAVNSSADDIICGGGLCNQPNMREIARQMRAILDRKNGQ